MSRGFTPIAWAVVCLVGIAAAAAWAAGDRSASETSTGDRREADSGASSRSQSPADASFQPPPLDVPEGFSIEPVATPPLVRHPMMIDVDPRGRLFVAESGGVNQKAKKLLKTRPHKILLLEDSDGDGRYDERTVFADDLVLPNGVLWHDGGLYVCSAPFLWRFEDTDGDGVADVKKKIFGKFGFNGMSSAFHGPTLGPGGRLYWCGGQHGWVLGDESAGRKPENGWTSKTPGVFSCRPDGSDPRVRAHGGLANPVEVTFARTGEVFGTVAVYKRVDGRRHDAVLHWVDGGVFNLHPKEAKGLTRTGPPLPPLSLRGQVAPAGLTRYRSTHFGDAYRGDLFVTEFNTHEVHRLSVDRAGATFRTSRDKVFLSSSSHDAHFTDVEEDADGTLLVVDTGGWFRYGCPDSDVAKPDILGAVYRVRRDDGDMRKRPRGNNLSWAEATPERLADRLDDPRFAVRDRTMATLADRGGKAVDALAEVLDDGTARARRHAVWALTRIEGEAARKAVRSALADEAFSVRLAATRSVATRVDSSAVDRLTSLVRNDEPAVRREAATALGRIRDAAAVPALLDALKKGTDRFLEHALIGALIRIDAPKKVAPALEANNAAVRRAALVALDQMDSGELTAETVARSLGARDERLRKAATRIVLRHKGWAGEIVGRFREWLRTADPTDARLSRIRGVVVAFQSRPPVRKAVAAALTDAKTARAVRLHLLAAIGETTLADPPERWVAAIRKLTGSDDREVARHAVRAAASLDAPALDGRMRTVAHDGERPAKIRLAALRALGGRVGKLPSNTFELLTDRLTPATDADRRLDAAEILGKADLTREQKLRLTDAVRSAGPLTLPPLLGAFEETKDPKVGSKLATALTKAPGVSNVRPERLQRILGQFPESTRSAAAGLLQKLRSAKEARKKRLRALQPILDEGDPDRGRDVFFSKKAACSVCHRIGDAGGTIGPNLTNIGSIRSERDLLESIVFPSATIAQGYQPSLLTLKDGPTRFGIVRRRNEKAIHLADPAGNTARIARKRVEKIRPSARSIMPAGLDRVLSEKQLADLVAFLRSTEAGSPTDASAE